MHNMLTGCAVCGRALPSCASRAKLSESRGPPAKFVECGRDCADIFGMRTLPLLSVFLEFGLSPDPTSPNPLLALQFAVEVQRLIRMILQQEYSYSRLCTVRYLQKVYLPIFSWSFTARFLLISSSK